MKAKLLYIEIVKYLLSKEADVNKKDGAGTTPLGIASHRAQFKILYSTEKNVSMRWIKIHDSIKSNYPDDIFSDNLSLCFL